jgi:anti-anti-sigma factor
MSARRHYGRVMGMGETGGTDAFTREEVPFGCVVHRHGDTSEIVLEGELDLATRPTLDEALETAMWPGPVATLLVDLTEVTFADSTTLAWLLAAHDRAQSAATRFLAVVGPGPVRTLLELTGLYGRFKVVPGARMR